jgi:hypothetical protein
MRHDLAADWIRYHAEHRKPSDPLFVACSELDDLIHSAPEEAWTVTLELVESAPDDRVLANVAAGPLEDLLTKSDRFLDRAEIQARRDPKFRRCLTGVWGLPASARDRFAKYVSTIKDPL